MNFVGLNGRSQVSAAETIDDITPGWLSLALGLDIRSVSAERIGTGQTGVTYRLMIDSSEGASTLVAKLASGDSQARSQVSAGYRAEVGFYEDIASTVKVHTPRCWYAAIADDSLTFTLLLDDLAPRVPGVQAEGCSIAQAGRAVENLAALHAPRWNDESLFDLAYMRRPTQQLADFLGVIVASATEVFLDRFQSDLSAGDVATLRAVAQAMTAWQMLRPTPFSVIHGDYRPDNLMFQPAGEDNDDVMVVDWQTLAVGPPARDLAYFLGSSLTTPTRRAAERELIARYHAALVKQGVTDYAAERCFDDYRIGQLQGPMITTLGCAYASGIRSRSSDEMFLAMAHRSCAAIRDLGSLEMIAASGSDPEQPDNEDGSNGQV